jgi:hypothetical protein
MKARRPIQLRPVESAAQRIHRAREVRPAAVAAAVRAASEARVAPHLHAAISRKQSQPSFHLRVQLLLQAQAELRPEQVALEEARVQLQAQAARPQVQAAQPRAQEA